MVEAKELSDYDENAQVCQGKYRRFISKENQFKINFNNNFKINFKNNFKENFMKNFKDNIIDKDYFKNHIKGNSSGNI